MDSPKSKNKEYCPVTVFTLFRASIPVWIGIRHTNPDLRPLTHTHLCPLYDYHVWPHSSYTSSRIVSLTQLCGLMICLGLVYYIITQMVFLDKVYIKKKWKRLVKGVFNNYVHRSGLVGVQSNVYAYKVYDIFFLSLYVYEGWLVKKVKKTVYVVIECPLKQLTSWRTYLPVTDLLLCSQTPIR